MQSQIPTAAVFTDLCSFGRAALACVTPTLSTLGVQVCPVPTALLSAHLGFKGGAYLDLTEYMQSQLAHWQSAGFTFNGVLTGFFSSPAQAMHAAEYIAALPPECSITVDPIMGDNGKFYGSVSADILPAYRSLCKSAGTITPNLTEAALLLGRELPESFTRETLKEWLQALSALGPKTVVLTSAPCLQGQEDVINTAIYTRETDKAQLIPCKKIPGTFHGTGDIFASVLVGEQLRGSSLTVAAGKAVAFVGLCMQATIVAGTPPINGVNLEACLPKLAALAPLPSEEL